MNMTEISFNPSIYEINTRVWLRRFDKEGKKAVLSDVPPDYWDSLREKGIDYVWLMGVWQGCESTIEKYCFEENLMKEYSRALKGWKREDVIGSPFAIDDYNVNPAVGTYESLIELKTLLNSKGMKLLLDFVPNHLSANSSVIKSNPYVFLGVGKEFFNRDPHTFFQPFESEKAYFAHGRDPFFPAWQDTIQINFFSIDARTFLCNVLINLTKMCDGVRCDMAMLPLNNVFKNTWGTLLPSYGFEIPKTEFWAEAIRKVKEVRPDFLFIAETYWDLEWNLQQLGFDYTYDKKLTDRLGYAPNIPIKEHLMAETSYQQKSLRFLENHDEDRAIAVFGKEKSKAAAVIISTILGMRFYFDGQFEGKKIKLPVQLGREPEEIPVIGMREFYTKLLKITSKEPFRHGLWKLLEADQAWENNHTNENLFAWSWNYDNEKRLVIVNYSDQLSSCLIKFDVSGDLDEFTLDDLLNDKSYKRFPKEIANRGLYIELKPWQSHIFSY
jgi:Alpha amylase, catalytic domain